MCALWPKKSQNSKNGQNSKLSHNDAMHHFGNRRITTFKRRSKIGARLIRRWVKTHRICWMCYLKFESCQKFSHPNLLNLSKINQINPILHGTILENFSKLTCNLVLESSFPAGWIWTRSTTSSFLKETPIISSSSRPWRKVTTKLAKINFPVRKILSKLSH